MDNFYNEALEFFVENGIQLTQEQVEALEEKARWRQYIDDEARKAKEYNEKADKMEKIAKYNKSPKVEKLIDKYKNKAGKHEQNVNKLTEEDPSTFDPNAGTDYDKHVGYNNARFVFNDKNRNKHAPYHEKPAGLYASASK